MLLHKEKNVNPAAERRWPGAMAVAAVAALHMALPDVVRVKVIPVWVLGAAVVLLEIPALLAHRRGWKNLPAILGMVASGLVTAFLLASTVLLIGQAINHTREATALLKSSTILWFANIIVFATWYWRLDAGGPRGRELVPGHACGAFLFPQMTLDKRSLPPDQKHWSPKFIDYLFLAFNTSTAFSPTDCAILSRWAKVLVMMQATLSLTLVALLVGRAVNAL
jgi:hypothetical protein